MRPKCPAAKSVTIRMLEGTKQGPKMETGWRPQRPPARHPMIPTAERVGETGFEPVSLEPRYAGLCDFSIQPIIL
jgi:hypothetical protein